MKSVFYLLAALLLVACSDSDNSPYYSYNLVPFVFVDDISMGDSVIYLKNDSVSIKETVDHYAFYKNKVEEDSNWTLIYHADARALAIHVMLEISPNRDGGGFRLQCGSRKDFSINFGHPEFPIKEKGYMLDVVDSFKVAGVLYRDVLVFDGTRADTNKCDMARFYYAANYGIVKVVSKNGIELSRIPEPSK